MKAKKFAVAVQWGAGHAYFLSYYDSEVIAMKVAEEIAKDLIKKRNAKPTKKRGTTPTVYVWLMTAAFDGGFQPLPRKPRSHWPQGKKEKESDFETSSLSRL